MHPDKTIITPADKTDRHQQAAGTTMSDEEIDWFEDRRSGILEPIVWTSKLAVGIEEIDTDHRELIALFNAILVAGRSKDKARLAALLEQLGDATAAHFQREEKLMADGQYEHTAVHQEEHFQHLEEYGHQVDDWRQNHISADLLCRFMYRWLLRHIVASDIPMAAAIRR